MAWILSSGQLWSIIYEKKLNLGLIERKADLKVRVVGGKRHKEETSEPRGIFMLILLFLLPVTPISRVDSSDGLVFKFDIVLMIFDYYSCSSN